MNKDILTIIIPAFNEGLAIKSTLQSLGPTAFKNKWDIIIVNDGSTDKTGEIARQFSVNVVDQDNQGPAIARNEGVKRASGEIIVFTDSDCVTDTHFVEEMIRPFIGSSVVGVKGAYRTRQTGIWARFAQTEFMERYAKLSRSESIDFVDSYAAAFRKDVFLQVGGFDAHFPVANNEDVDLSYRIARLGHPMVFNPNAIVYHTHPNSMKAYLKLKFSRAYWRMLVYRKFPEKIVSDSYTPQSLKFQILTAGLMILMIPGAFFSPAIAFALLWFSGLFFAATSPFVFRAFQNDPAIVWFCPWAVFLRSCAFGTGILFGMIAQRRRSLLFPLLLLLSDTIAALGAYFAAYWIRAEVFSPFLRPFDHTISLYLSLFPLVLTILLISCQSYGLYREKSHHSRVKEFTSVTRAVSYSVLAIVIISFFLKWDYSRFFIPAYWIVAIVFVNVFRSFVRRIQDRLRRKGLQTNLSIIVGVGEAGRNLLDRLKLSGDAGQKVVGLVDDIEPDPDDPDWKGIQWLGPVSDLESIIVNTGVDDVYIAKTDWPHQKVLDLVVQCEKTGAGFKIVSDLATIVTGGAMLSSVSGIPVIDLKEERHDWGRRTVKRCVDLILSSVFIILSLPIMIMVGLFVHLLIQGSILIEQERVGRNGRLFKMLRFRTASATKDQIVEHKIGGFGHFLQRSHLDELPQLLNVLRGEMSMVGPRPEVPEIVSTYEAWQRKRLDVSPGMTGLWQILGPSERPLHENLEYDFYYIKNYSIWMDLSILVQTIPVILAGKGKITD